MIAASKLDHIARILADQRTSLEPIDLAEDLRPANEAEAYLLQGEVNRRLAESRLGKPVGYKIGCTTPVMQAFLGIPNPCAGEVFEATVLRDGGCISHAAYRKLGVECELVVDLARELSPTEAPFTPERAAEAIGSIMAGMEIVDDRYRDYRSIGVPSLIADNFFNAGCVLGEPIRADGTLDLSKLEGSMRINGRDVGRGIGAMVLGHPHKALAWLANSRAQRGLGLERGRFVFLGSLVETKWLNPGDEVSIAIGPLGALNLSVSA